MGIKCLLLLVKHILVISGKYNDLSKKEVVNLN
jgi:hypothetical protein